VISRSFQSSRNGWSSDDGLMLKEEVRITRVRSTERYQQTVKLRYQEAVVTRQNDDK
jgi:hypothetical protein